MGRRDEIVTDKLKEKFIDKLTDFREREGKFYYYRAYCIAAICVGEFRSSRRAEAIVSQIIEWAFGHSDEEKRWITDLDWISLSARDTILFTSRMCVINKLVQLLQCSAHVFYRVDVARILEKIDSDNLSQWRQINPDNQDEIDSLVRWLLNDEQGLNDTSRIAEELRQNGVGNQFAIDSLVQVIQVDYLHDFFFAELLGQIGVGNQFAIDSLVQVIRQDDLDDDIQIKPDLLNLKPFLYHPTPPNRSKSSGSPPPIIFPMPSPRARELSSRDFECDRSIYRGLGMLDLARLVGFRNPTFSKKSGFLPKLALTVANAKG
jgi:hypothetical protein